MNGSTRPLAPLLLALTLLGCAGTRNTPGPDSRFPIPENHPTVPEWAADVVWYQIFPERFRNGDPSNDPTRASLETPVVPSERWRVSPWTGDWYARDEWEREMGPSFYEHGVFHRRYGGDLQGVIDGLDYLRQLGVTGLYFNPVFYARSLHKYDGNTFHHVDPHFGPDPEGDFRLMARETSDPATWHWTEADRLFLRLVREAHRRDMKVVIDGVFNHTGRDFFAFEHLREHQQQSPYRDWYIVTAYDDPATPQNEFAYKGWWGVETLPEFADTPDGADLHPGPKAYVFDATRRWMDPDGDGRPDDGIDGWRLDVANEVPIKFWADWNRLVHGLNPDAYTVTEIWENASEFLERGGFSATMNYHGFAFPVKGFLIDGTMPATEFAAEVERRAAEYDPAHRYAHQNLIDSHDTDRLASMIVNRARRPYQMPERFDYDAGERVSPRQTDRYEVRAPNAGERRIQRLVALAQATFVGAPMIYYGTEAGMWGADDPDDRMPMVWRHLAYDAQREDPLGRPRPADSVRFDERLFDFYRELIRLRQDHPALRRGGYERLAADDARQTLAFLRQAGGEALVVVFNRSEQPQEVVLPRERLQAAGARGERLATLFATDDRAAVDAERSADGFRLRLPGLTGAVLRLR